MIEDFKQNHANNRINFEIKLLPEYAEKFKKDDKLLMKTFKLVSSISLNNMVLFDKDEKLKQPAQFKLHESVIGISIR